MRYLVARARWPRSVRREAKPRTRPPRREYRRTDADPRRRSPNTARGNCARPAERRRVRLGFLDDSGMFDACAGRQFPSSAGPLVVEHAAVRVCGGAVVVCRAGGARVRRPRLGGEAPRAPLRARARELGRVLLLARAPGGKGARCRYVPRGRRRAGRRRETRTERTKTKSTKHQKHCGRTAIPAGRARLAVAVAAGPPESRRRARWRGGRRRAVRRVAVREARRAGPAVR